MKKNRFIKVLVLFFAVALLSSAMVVQATSSRSQTNTNNVGTQGLLEDIAQDAVDALFTDSTHTKLIPGVTKTTINLARSAVNVLFPSPLKTLLLNLVDTADELLIAQQEEAAKIAAATQAVNDLFTDDSHSGLRLGITLVDIQEAETLVDDLLDPLVKAPLKALLVIAHELFDILNLEIGARSAVDGLFTDSTHSILKLTVTQGDIDNARGLVDGLTNIVLRAELNLLITSAQVMLDLRTNEQRARDAVYALFSDGQHTTIKAGLTQAEIDEAKNLVNALSGGDVKTELTILISSAQSQLDGKSAEDAATDLVNSMFVNGGIVPGLTQATIDNARNVVNALPDGPVKDNLLGLVNTAQTLFNTREAQVTIVAEARSAVDGLFTDSTHNQIKANITQTDIDNAQAKVNLVADAQIKADLNTQIQKAQDLLDAREEQDQIAQAAQAAVYALFKDSSHTVIKDGLTQAEINAAQTKVNLMVSSTLKVQLNLLIANAQAQLDLQTPESLAAAIVDALFKNADHNELIDGITQAVIDNARNVVNALPNSEIKDSLLDLVNHAQNLYDQATETPAEQEARAAVDALFSDINHTQIKDDTDQDAIDAAKAKVDALSAGATKTELTNMIIKAQDLLDERIARNAVDALFTDAGHTALNPGVTQITVDAANDLVVALKDGSVKSYLLQQIAIAYDLLTETPAEQEARAAIDDLFTDGTHTALKDTTTQAMINAARVKVNNLPAGSTKTDLTILATKAQDLFNERNARNAVNALFTDDTHTDIKADTNQTKINAATALVNALKDGPVKTELYEHLAEAQQFLDQRMEAQAIEAVDNLYTDINHTAIKDTTTQAMISAAVAKVNALRAGQTKTDLTVLVVRAQDLLNERNATILVEGFFVDDTHQALKRDVFRPMIRDARDQVLALKPGQVRVHLLELLEIADRYLDDHQPQEGDEYTYWNGTGTYWYRYMGRERWWNWKITTPQYTTQTYYATFRCVSEMPEPMNCATLNTRYDFTKDSTGRIIAQKYQKWDVKELIYSYRLFTYNPTLNILVKTYDKETRYYSNTRLKRVDVQNKNLNNDKVSMKDKLEYRSNGVQQRYFYYPHNAANGLPQRLDKVVYNSSGEKRTRGSSRAYFYRQSYNASGKRTTTYRWTYNTSGKKTNRISYKEIKY